MKNRWNYYKLLHVQPDAPVEIIRSSYRTLMLKLKQHPDMGGDDWNAALINEAYETLADAEKRAKYDRELLGFNKVKVAKGVETLQAQETNRKNEFRRYQHLNSIPSYSCPFCKTFYSGDIHMETERLCNYCRSPLNPVVKMRLNTEQGRAVKRMAAQHSKITFYTSWPQDGYHGHIQDLSPMGVQIHTEEMLQKEQLIKIESDILNATANVVYCRSQDDGGLQGYVIGVKFFTLWLQQALGTFLSVTA
ncbi:MAG: J domain-containing protein [Deltaproteobacteria bacterium]|nr:J domain-containing protein [Deltaproteobacteria bacterium]